jgi:hypothetical protein
LRFIREEKKREEEEVPFPTRLQAPKPNQEQCYSCYRIPNNNYPNTLKKHNNFQGKL